MFGFYFSGFELLITWYVLVRIPVDSVVASDHNVLIPYHVIVNVTHATILNSFNKQISILRKEME